MPPGSDEQLELAFQLDLHCEACGCHYRVRRNVRGLFDLRSLERTQELPEEVTEEFREVEGSERKTGNPKSCPTCGRIPLYHACRKNINRYGILAFATTGGILALVAFCVRSLTPNGGWLVAGVAACYVPLFVYLNQLWSNLPSEEGLKRTQKLIRKGKVQVISQGRGENHTVDRWMRFLRREANLLAVISVPVIAIAPLAVSISDAPINSAVVPAVVGPGDECRVQFPQSIEAANGMWRGTPVVVVRNADELGGAVAVRARGSDRTWDSLAFSKKNDRNDRITPTAMLEIPVDPNLEGKILRLHITMRVEYPYATARLETQKATVERDLDIAIARPGQQSELLLIWQPALYSGLTCLALCPFALFAFSLVRSRQVGSPKLEIVWAGGAN